jgi:leucyl aminopeptidase (aminopeptidase T)
MTHHPSMANPGTGVLPVWQELAGRAVDALGVRAGELVQVRDRSGRLDVLLEMLLAIERVGATPLPELLPPSYLNRLLCEAPAAYLSAWDRHRMAWMRQIERVLVLQGVETVADGPPAGTVDAWRKAVSRLVEVEEARRLPYLVVAVPPANRSGALGGPPERLEQHVLPALAVSPGDLEGEIERVLAVVRGGRHLTLRTADGAEWHASLAGRRWLADDGRIDDEDRCSNAHVGNLPAGAIYTTVVESTPAGQLWLPEAAGARDVRLTFEDGRIVGVDAREGREHVVALLERHSGDRDRISHVGIGLNPALRGVVGWPLVDEHVHGTVLVALGENRYLGGQNQSDLNVDFALPQATLLVDGRLIVEAGRLVV